MGRFLIGAGVALVGAWVGWLLSFLTDRRKNKRLGKSAARVIFFELGLFLSAALAAYDGDWEYGRDILSRDAWERYGRDLAETAGPEIMHVLARLYSSNFAQISSLSTRDLPVTYTKYGKAAFTEARDAVALLAPLAGIDKSTFDLYIAPFEAAADTAWGAAQP